MTIVWSAPYCFGKSRGVQHARGSEMALKDFKALQKDRADDPTSPEKLVDAGYVGDEFLKPETMVTS